MKESGGRIRAGIRGEGGDMRRRGGGKGEGRGANQFNQSGE